MHRCSPDHLEVWPCGCCGGYVASYGAWCVEDDCPVRACARVLELFTGEQA